MIVKTEKHVCIICVNITNTSVKLIIDAVIVNAVEH